MLAEKASALTALCRRFKVKRLYLFGSAARGGFQPEASDLDFFVALDESSPAEYTENYFGLAHELERLFGRRVDLVTERSVRNPYFRQVLETTRQLVYEG
ncbi:MAG: nucleotidyltransferase domain-containing protein [Verrucomicrobiota bacterium]